MSHDIYTTFRDQVAQSVPTLFDAGFNRSEAATAIAKLGVRFGLDRGQIESVSGPALEGLYGPA